MKTSNVIKRLIKLLKKDKILFFIALLAVIINVASTLFIPIIVGKAIDTLAYKEFDLELINYYVFLIVILIVLSSSFSYLNQFLMNKITNNLLKNLRDEAFYKLDYLPISYIDQNSEGDLIMRLIGDVDQLGDGLLQALTQFISGIVTIIFTLVFMFVLSYQVALIIVCLTPLSLLSAYLISKYSYRTFKAQAKIKGDMSSHLNETLNMWQTVVCYNKEEDANIKLEAINEDLYKVGVRAQFLSSLVNPVTRFINALVYASVCIFGGLKVISGLITVGDLTVFLNYASSYTKPFNDISAVAAELQNSFASARRVFAIIDEKIIEEDSSESLNNLVGSVSFNNVSFSYNGTKQIIKNFNLDVNPKMKVALVGSTGCGKTTLINLLMRFYEVTEGSISIDGKNIKDISKMELRSKMGMVLQDTWVYKASVLDNIRYGSPNATKDDVIEAAKKTYVHELIERLPEGYNTIISDDSGLSSGEKQLICITRLMLKNPEIIILDEATSALDTRLEILVNNAFNNLISGHTSFVIAHRLQTILNSDLIVVIDKGEIVEVGKHQDLLEKNGFYSKLFKSQYQSI